MLWYGAGGVNLSSLTETSGPGIWVVPRLPKPAKGVRVPWAAPTLS